MRPSIITIAVVACLLAGVSGAAAADKEHQQLMAEIRMLQEQQMQLQQILGSLADTLKSVTVKLDEQTAANRKALADQRLLIEGVGETARILREKADDTNVRLASMTQELEAMRQTIASQPAPTISVPTPDNPADPGAATPDTAAPSAAIAAPPAGISPQRMYDNAFGDYAAGHYDIAVLGFETFVKTFPRHNLADEAQTNIGHSLFGAGKYQEAVAALQKVVSDYPDSNSVPAAYYKLGLTYQALEQDDLARKAFEIVMKNHERAPEASLAKQALDRMARNRE
jgi:tol-pal system protein YbgF